MPKTDLSRIEGALAGARDFKTFAHRLLRDCLNWPIDRNAGQPDEIGYRWSGDELRFEGMAEKLVARELLLTDRSEQPYGIFLLEFKEPRVFETKGFTMPLRKALRGLVDSRRKNPNLRSWQLDQILFICTHDYQQYVFAQFWDPFSTRKVSEARLATFGWVPGMPSRTAVTHNLPYLVWPEDREGWKDWRKAFDKQPLTDLFFRHFDQALDEMKTDLEKLGKLKSSEAYSRAQLLLERLIFLYFVQNRGWLNQQRDFLRRNFKPHELKPDACTYYSEFLDVLFWSLSVPPSKDTRRMEGVPFLNGGLFDDDEFDPGTRHKRTSSTCIRNGTLQRVFDEFLEAFNFTVREDTPLNQEVAVDPEMLGKVFESIVLHAESADPDANAPDKRKATGSYYTPRIVVHFICREVLYQYLLPRMSGSDWSARLRRLLELDASDGLSDEEKAILRQCLSPTDGARLLELVAPLRCCDPAVGSGAFMVGLLHELTNLRRLAQTAANGYRDPVGPEGSRWLQETKADIIQSCLFGVDIQQQAVEICMLRLWLSLVVDYDLGMDPFAADTGTFKSHLDGISQLPNLEMNFKRGDSLHDHICGVPVVVMPGKLHGYESRFSEIQKLGGKLHHAKSSEYKRKLRLQILDKRIALSEQLLDDELRSLRQRDSTLVNLFGEGKSEAEQRKRIAVETERLEAAKVALAKSRKELDDLVARPLERNFQPRLRKLEGADFDSPFNFVWRIDFPQVFSQEEPEATLKGEFPFVNDLKGQATLVTTAAIQGGFDIIVGNPPFVTARNPVRRELWRERWQPYCHMKYHMLVPFFPLSFSLLKSAGELGFIVSNAFAKREFGKPVIEEIFAKFSIQKLVDCSGLMFPGHGTPTCLVFAGNATSDPGSSVRVVALQPGGGDLRTPPEESKLWHTLEQRHEETAFTGDGVSVVNASRRGLFAWPFEFNRSAAELTAFIEQGRTQLVEFIDGGIGFDAVTGGDEVFTVRPDLARRRQVPLSQLRLLLPGDSLRNWTLQNCEMTIFPYQQDDLYEPTEEPNAYLLDFSSQLKGRIYFGQTNKERGLKWWEFAIVMWRKRETPTSIAYCDISTHCHSALGNIAAVFPQSVQVIKLHRTSKGAEHTAMIGLLNASAVLFWLKQVCFSKRESEDAESDTYYELSGGKVEQLPVPDKVAQALRGEWNLLATRLAELAQACWERGQMLPSLAMKKLFEKSGEAYHRWNSSLPGNVEPHKAIGDPFETAKELKRAFDRVVAERERLRSEMIALQEEMDWLVYAAYGLLPEDSAAVGFGVKSGTVHSGTVPCLPEPLDRNLRPYRLWQKSEGEFDAAVALIPADWIPERKALWRARLEAIRDNEHIRRIEQPVYKRRWDEQWKVRNRWECGPVAYETELRDAFDWWLREKAESWLERKANDQQATLHDWAKALWKDERIRAAVEVVEPSAAELDGELPVPELVPQGFERLLKEVVDEETVPAGIPFAKPWDELGKKKLTGLAKARSIRGKLNVPRERFHLVARGVYSWAGRLFSKGD